MVSLFPSHDRWNIVKYNIEIYLKKLFERTMADEIEVFFTDSYNFREEVATLLPYKGNRDTTHKPFWFKDIREYLLSNYPCSVVYGVEADDAMAIEQCRDEGEDTVIFTPDKDLDMIEGWRDNGKECYYIDKGTTMGSFYEQLLKGDSTDNIPGIFKLTGKKASKKMKDGLKETDDPYNYIKELYLNGEESQEAHDDIERKLLEIGTLLWMKRDYHDRVEFHIKGGGGEDE